MSVESFAIAINHSRAKSTTKLVLLGIANHDGDGGAWPSVATLQRYAGGVDRSTVQRAIDQLERLGEVRRLVGMGGDHSTADHRRPNLYKFLLTCPHDCDRTSQHRTPRQSETLPLDLSTGAAPVRPGSADAAGGGRVDAARTILLTQDTHLVETGSSTRARELCPHGHPIVDRSAAGVPFCALGCASEAVLS